MKSKANIRLLLSFIFLLDFMPILAQVTLLKRKELLQHAVFESNHFDLHLSNIIMNKAKAVVASGTSSFKTASSSGLLAGFSFTKNINTHYNISFGLDCWLSGRNFEVIYRKQDFNPPLEKSLTAKTKAADLIAGATLLFGRRNFYHHYRYFSFAMGMRINYSTGADLDITSILIEPLPGSQLYEAAKVAVNANNDAKPWLSLPLLAGHSWLLKNNNLFSTEIIGNISLSNYVTGSFLIKPDNISPTSGSYSARGSYFGIQLKYTFTNTNNFLRKKIENQ